jgi:hypothetical protein
LWLLLLLLLLFVVVVVVVVLQDHWLSGCAGSLSEHFLLCLTGFVIGNN